MDDLSDYLKPPRHGAWRIWLVAVLLAFGTVYLGIESFRLYQAGVLVRARTEQWRRSHQLRPPAKLSKKAIEESKRWSELKAERTFEWDALFRAVERASSEDIELLEFHPDSANRRILMRGEARNRASLIRFLEALSSQPSLETVHLTHQQTMVRDQLETQAFEIKATIRR